MPLVLLQLRLDILIGHRLGVLSFLLSRTKTAGFRLDEVPEAGGYSPQEHSGEATWVSTCVLAPSEYRSRSLGFVPHGRGGLQLLYLHDEVWRLSSFKWKAFPA